MCLLCRLLAQWLKQPLRDRHAIVERHDVVQVILEDTTMRQALRDEHLRRIPDLQALSKKLGRKKAGLQDCYRWVTCADVRKVTSVRTATVRCPMCTPQVDLPCLAL
jgi:DNA mismatch repair ATPase MutS